MEAQLLPLLYQNLERLQEENKEDSDGIHMTLGVYLVSIILVTSTVKRDLTISEAPMTFCILISVVIAITHKNDRYPGKLM